MRTQMRSSNIPLHMYRVLCGRVEYRGLTTRHSIKRTNDINPLNNQQKFKCFNKFVVFVFATKRFIS